MPSLALVAVCGAALVFGITHVRRELPVEKRAATAEPAVSPPASGDKGSATLATGANAVATAPAVSPRAPDTDEFMPVFDNARIEPNGDAVIAGRAAPDAIVELLRNGEPHDRAVADQSGQFVMVPPRLLPGDYDLTLRSRRLPHATAAALLLDRGSPPTVAVPKIATTIVSAGDSLWCISRVTYGAGMQYAVVYKANRDHIRNPNRIYPGQIFVLPMKAR